MNINNIYLMMKLLGVAFIYSTYITSPEAVKKDVSDVYAINPPALPICHKSLHMCHLALGIYEDQYFLLPRDGAEDAHIRGGWAHSALCSLHLSVETLE